MAKSTAAALLRDDNFIIKYPALARALKESVELQKDVHVKDAPQPAAAKPSGLHEALISPTPSPGFSLPPDNVASKCAAVKTTGLEKPLPVEMGVASSEASAWIPNTVSGEQQSPVGASLNEAKEELSECEQRGVGSGTNANTEIAPGAQCTSHPEGKPLDPPLHYMKR